MARKTKTAKPRSAKAQPSGAQGQRVRQEEVDHLARHTLNLWRDQMMAVAQSPKAMRELSKVMEPALNLFTQSLDMWLMMLDQTGKGFAMPSWPQPFTGGENDKGAHAKSRPASAAQASAGRSESARREGGASRKKRPASGAKAAAVASGRSAASVAELAKRVADLKERGKRPAGAAAAARVAGSAGNVTELAVARQKRRRKA